MIERTLFEVMVVRVDQTFFSLEEMEVKIQVTLAHLEVLRPIVAILLVRLPLQLWLIVGDDPTSHDLIVIAGLLRGSLGIWIGRI